MNDERVLFVLPGALWASSFDFRLSTFVYGGRWSVIGGRSSRCLLVSLSPCLLVSDFVLRPSSFVRSRLRIKNHGYAVGGARRLRLEQRMDARVVRVHRRGGVPVDQR